MDDIKKKDAEIAPVSFIQTKVKQHLTKIHNSLKKVNDVTFAGTMINVLVEVAQQSVNLETINKIIVLIQDLQKNILLEIDSSKKANEEDKAQSASLIEELNKNIDQEKDNIAKWSAKLSEVNSKIGFLNNNMSIFYVEGSKISNLF